MTIFRIGEISLTYLTDLWP